jgi:predicted dehydrogenase
MKVGIIGVGSIAQIHLRALTEQGQEVVALCDVETKNCEQANETFNLHAKIFSDYKEMLASVTLDVVHICTPHYLHAPMVCEGLRRNVNVLCEKPLAINEEQLKTVEIAVKESKAQLGVCFQNHFNDAVLYVKEFLKGKKIVCASANLVWERNAEYYACGAWRGTWDQEGGAVMINQAIHGLDILQWLCGMPESVIGYISNNSLRGVIEAEDTAFGIYKLKNGGNFIVNATNAGKFCFPIYYMFRTEEDTVELTGNNIIINDRFITKEDNLPIYGKEVWGTGHAKLIKNFYACVEERRRFSIGYEEAKNTVLLIRGLYKSNGEEIFFNEV